MKIVYWTLILLIFRPMCSFSGEVLYKVADIPPELKANARSVVRNMDIILEIKSPRDAKMKVLLAITVLNKNGLEDAMLEVGYDKYSTVSGFKGRVFDQYGELVKKIAQEDFNDYSAISGFSLFEDNRIKAVDPEIRDYPFTVEYQYEINYNGFFQLPWWIPIIGVNVSVEKSTFTVITAPSLEIKYLERNLPGPVVITSVGENTQFRWEINNFQAIVYEPISPYSEEYQPYVIVVPVNFEIGGYPGKLESWNDLGNWIGALNNGRDVLPPEVVSELSALVKDETSDYNKVCTLYKYMQDRVRYVYVSIGMGDWQPLPAADVHRLCYGDCKALSNYMMAILKAVGINSHYCLVRAGENSPGLIRDFPSSQFNHAILCVPLNADTMWLECTNVRKPCGYLGKATDDREVLLVDDEGSRIVHTIAYPMEENSVSRMSRVNLNEDGSGTVVIDATYSGLEYDEMSKMVYSDEKDRKKMISEKVLFPAFQVTQYSYEESRLQVPSVRESITIDFQNYLTSVGSNTLLIANCVNRFDQVPPNVRSRKRDIFIRRSFQETDSIWYSLSTGLKVVNLPEEIHHNTPYGTYDATFTLAGGKLLYTRHVEIWKGRYPPTAYVEVVEFLTKVSEADATRCILSKNE